MGKKIIRNYDNNGNLISKECYKCHEIKGVGEFHKNKSKKDGISSTCKECKKEYDAEIFKQNIDKIKEQKAEYYKQNADNIKGQRIKRYNSKVEQSLSEIKAYIEKDPERFNYDPNKEIYGIVYLVYNNKSQLYYVGQTTNSFDIRYQNGWLYDHKHKDTVKEDLEKYGEDSFEYTKIFKVAHNQEELDKIEAYYIEYFDSYENGYNETRGNIFTERSKN